MGYLVVQREPTEQLGALACLIAASSLLYTAGMILNDVFDVEVDRQQRPQRPLPSGAIPLRTASLMGYGLLVAGVVAAAAAGWIQPRDGAIPWRSGAVAVTLAMTIVLYDGVLKKTFLGPVAMGACRFLNVLLGMSTGVAAARPWQILGYTDYHFFIAGGIGVYIMGVTWFARSEAVGSERLPLIGGLLLMISGMILLGSFTTRWPAEFGLLQMSPRTWVVLLGLLGLVTVRRCGAAIQDPSPMSVQSAVKHGILSLIMLDAAVVLMTAEPYWWSVGIVSLLVPTMLLGIWVYST